MMRTISSPSRVAYAAMRSSGMHDWVGHYFVFIYFKKDMLQRIGLLKNRPRSGSQLTPENDKK